MPRAIWKGSLTFGLVEIPVELVPAERTNELKFTLVDRRDHAPVGYRRVNKNTGREVPWEEIVKAYEHEEGDYVLLSDEELKRANPEATQTIEILDFVDPGEIHPAYWDRPYYLKPLKKKGNKAYALLREVLRRKKRVGIARLVVRTRQHLAAVTSRGLALTLVLLRYAYELRDTDELGLTDEALEARGLRKDEVRLAEELIDGMSLDWKPEKYEDEYREDVLALVKKKVAAGQREPIEPPPESPARERHGEVLDLMPLLQRSVEARTARKARRSTSNVSEVARPARRRSA
jgi:DNA end-binding protein Ku